MIAPSPTVALVHVLRGLIGMAGFIGIAVLFSSNRRAISWRLVGITALAQIAIAVLVLKVGPVRGVIDLIGHFFVKLLDFTNVGAAFLFGKLITDRQSFGLIFAFNVLPSIVFFSALCAVLYYLGVLQRVVYVFAWLLTRALGLSGPESLAVSANILLVGQTETPLLIKPYLAGMTRSEILTMMVGGMATIAGAVLVAYISILGGDDPAQRALFARHLLTATCMSVPGAVLTSKILLPQTEPVSRQIEIPREQIGANALDAIALGTYDGVKLAVIVGAILLVFLAGLAMINWMLAGWVGSWTGLNAHIAGWTGGRYDSLSLQYVFGLVFAPLAWLMGIGQHSLLLAGQVIGEKTILNEFVAYSTLGRLKDTGVLTDRRAEVILTYALCGFSNLSSIGIQVGGISALAPSQRTNLAQLGVKALIGGSLSCFLTACVAGMLT